MATKKKATKTANAGATARAVTALHELDEVVINTSKTRMKGVAAPLLARIVKLEKAAVRGIDKREAFLAAAGEYADELRDAYDDGDEAFVGKLAKTLDTYEASLLRPSRRVAR